MRQDSLFGDLNHFESAGLWLVFAFAFFLISFVVKQESILLALATGIFSVISAFASLYNIYLSVKKGEADQDERR